jgi:hypothetical protein
MPTVPMPMVCNVEPDEACQCSETRGSATGQVDTGNIRTESTKHKKATTETAPTRDTLPDGTRKASLDKYSQQLLKPNNSRSYGRGVTLDISDTLQTKQHVRTLCDAVSVLHVCHLQIRDQSCCIQFNYSWLIPPGLFVPRQEYFRSRHPPTNPNFRAQSTSVSFRGQLWG